MIVLGVSAHFHDSAATLLRNGEIAAAVQEERLTRIKHDPSFPFNAIKSCFKQAKMLPRDVDFVAYSEKPFLKFDRLFETALAFAPSGFLSFKQSMPIWLTEKLFQKRSLLQNLSLIDENVSWKKNLGFLNIT